MKKILIIGAKGMLGQELVRVFSADKNYQTIGWDIEDIDITNRTQTEEKVLALAPEIIINAVAYNNVDKCEELAEFEIAKEINGAAPGHLARIARKLDAIFVHYSTDYVFDGEDKNGYREDAIPSPISNYGRSKLLGEQEISRGGGEFYIIRLQRLFGRPSSKFQAASQQAAAKRSFFDIMLELAKTREQLEVIDEELANFTYAPDLAGRTKDIIEQNLSYGIYHITNEGRPVTWFGAVKILFKIAGIDNVKLIPVSADKFLRLAKRPKYSILLNTKLPALRPWDESLKKFLEK